jgi:hypothetical protein
MTSIDYFKTEKVNFTGFVGFCKKNLRLLAAVTIALVFSHGIKLFWHSIGVDTDLFMANTPWFGATWEIQIGRFGLSLLRKIWYIDEFNPFATTFIAICLIWLCAVSWCYIISVFSKNTGKNNNLIPFALLIVTVPVWAEIVFFQFISVETIFIVFICPYVIYMFYKGFFEHRQSFIITAFILLIFMTSVYQAVIPLFCCGVFICFIILYEHSDYDLRIYRTLCLKIFISLILVLIVYSIFNRILIDVIFSLERSEYLNEMIQWRQRSLKDVMLNISIYGYKLTIGHSKLVQNITGPIIANVSRTGYAAAEHIARESRVLGNIFLLPFTIFFIIEIVRSIKRFKKENKRVTVFYILAGIGIPLSIMLLPILLGGGISVRQQFVLPFSFSFMLYYVMEKNKKYITRIIWCIGIVIAIYQAQTTSQLYYTDYRRYQKDVSFSTEVDRMVRNYATEKPDGIPLAFIGKYQPEFTSNYLYGDVIGYSSFGWTGPSHRDYYESTERGLAFMNSLGFNYEMPNEEQMKKARDISMVMPNYPSDGCVRLLDDVIVVKISDSVYSP